MCMSYKTFQKRAEFCLSSLLIAGIAGFIYKFLPNASAILVVGGLALGMNVLYFYSRKSVSGLLKQVIRYRYWIALIVFLLCVLFRLHGSSIGVYNVIWPDKGSAGTLFGISRSIRSDEFNVQLPYYFSQYYNQYRETSHQMSLAGQNMILGYNAPVWDLTMIGKPFTWGYLLFGNEIGLSWYWSSKTLLFVLMTFEMLKIMTRNEKAALLGACILVFSPSMQWWFSPHMYDVFFWASALFVSGYYFFTADQIWLKGLTTLTSVSALVGFVIALFPAIQITAGMLVFALFIVCLIRDKEQIHFKKTDWFRGGLVLLGVGLVLGHFVIAAGDEIKLLYSTVYPGNRMVLGRTNTWSDLFLDYRSFLLPFRNPSTLNASELSTFNHLGPLCMSYFPYLYYRVKKEGDPKDLRVGLLLVIAGMIEACFMIVGFPKWLARITLFSYCNRMKIVYGFTATLLTIWSAVMMVTYHKILNKRISAAYALVFLAVSVALVPSMTDLKMVKSYGIVFYWIAVCVAMMAGMMLLQWKHMFIASAVGTMVLTGCTVNPVDQGIAALEDHHISKFIGQYPKFKEGNWIATESVLTQNFLLANGMKTLNAVNFYPDYGKWRAIDPKGSYDNIYNRYAHIQMSIKKKTRFYLKSPDLIEVHIGAKDLKKWKVKYILSQQDYKVLFTQNGIEYKIIYKDSKGYNIYQLVY